MQRFIGRVIGTATQKTCKVCVARLVMHPKYPKRLRVKRNYLVHDEQERAVVGDIVAIEYFKKMSKTKAFVMTEVLKEARSYLDPRSGKTFTAP